MIYSDDEDEEVLNSQQSSVSTENQQTESSVFVIVVFPDHTHLLFLQKILQENKRLQTSLISVVREDAWALVK